MTSHQETNSSSHLDKQSSHHVSLNLWFNFFHHYHHLSHNHEGRWDTTDDFTTRFFIFPFSPLPSGTWQTPGLPIPGCCLPILFLFNLNCPKVFDCCFHFQSQHGDMFCLLNHCLRRQAYFGALIG